MNLHRINLDRNMARFYSMTPQPTLFGEWALLREWGRIGSAGRLVSGRFASEEEAALTMAQHLKAKLSKGYEVQNGRPYKPSSCHPARNLQQARHVAGPARQHGSPK